MAVRGVLAVFAGCLLGLAGGGCSSVYRKPASIYPPTPCARLRLDLDEAHRAQKRAEQACATLGKALKSGLKSEAVEADVDRLEMAALDFKRYVVALNDSGVSCEDREQHAVEIQELQHRSNQFLEAITEVRRSDVKPPELEQPYRSSPAP